VVVDIDGIDVAAARKADRVEGRGAVQRVRTGRRGPDQLRVVLDVSQAVVTRSFALEPTEEYGHRLVIDLGNVVAAAPAATVTATAAAPPASDTSIGVVEKPIGVRAAAAACWKRM
jgi:N-acetylmuramoyl-L-alanine amidase